MASPPAGPGASVSRGGQQAAIDAITAPTLKGDGYRLLLVGMTGCGKTHVARKLAALPGAVVLIHDDAKAQPEYSGIARYFVTVEEMLARPLEELERDRVGAFRGDAYRGIDCPAESVADLALMLARARVPVRLIMDEFDRCVSDGGRKLEAPSVRTAFIQGRRMGLSVICNVQIPQRMPDIAVQASAVALFRLEVSPLSYLLDRFSMAPELEGIVPALPDGDFVIHRTGYPWDRRIYRFDP